MRVTKILLRLVCSFLVVAFSAGGYAQNVTISGSLASGTPITTSLGIAVKNLDGSNTTYSASRPGGGLNFTVSVPPGMYAVQVKSNGYTDPVAGKFVNNSNYFSAVGVDARNGSVSNVVVPLSTTGDARFDEDPPVASLISVGTADANGVAVITGAAGAAKPVAVITAINLWTGQYNHATSAPDGSFSMRLFAPPGSVMTVSQDPSGRIRPYFKTQGASTTVRVPAANESSGGYAMMTTINPGAAGEKDPGLIATEGLKDAGQLYLSGTLANLSMSPGQTGTLTGQAVLYSQEINTLTLSQVNLGVDFLLVRVLDRNGNLEHFNPEAMSTVLTPSGFPIERGNSNDATFIGTLSVSALTKTSGRTATAPWTLSYTIPADLPDGTYQLTAYYKTYNFNLPSNTTFFTDVFPNLFIGDRYFTYMTAAPLIRVGSTPQGKLSWVLAMNDLSQGSRGIVANEDRSRFAIAPHIITNAQKIILPRVNAKTGAALSYNLEPFVPLVAAGNKGTMSVPTLNFKFPSGQLNVLVKTPLGVTQNLGSAQFKETYMQEAVSLSGNALSPNSNKPSEFYGLTTLDERFETTFADYGLHQITLSGNIDDIYGNRYTAQGTYDLYVANPLDLETGVFPSTPFVVGDTFSPTLHVQPGVPADVEIRVKVYPNSSTAQMKETVIRGKANDYGYFQPASGTPLVFTDAGEYRVDYTASYTDSDGVLWMASASWGSVIETPNSSIVTHGRRGYEASTGNGTQQWYTLTGIPFTNPHVYFPYQNGDVIWMDDPDADTRNIAMQSIVTLQDPNSLITSTLTSRIAKIYGPAYNQMGFGYSSRASTGELPLISTTSTGLSPALVPTAADANWAYAYMGSARPGVRVREMVSEEDTKNSYWRFDDTYNYQLGNGMNGDEPNDFKFQFGGAVYRAPGQNFYYYGAYGNLFVLLPTSDTVGARTTPPFQGASGGPSGGPLFTLKGKGIDMFYHPQGVRPGDVLEKGDIAAFAGQIGPTLNAKVTLTITKPDGATVTVNGQANKVGYFYLPATNFTTDQVGRYKVQVSVIFDGRTSSGLVEAPYPRGDVLGSDDGSYFFYVVEPNAEPLRFSLAKSSFLAARSNNANVPVYSVPILQPGDLSNVAVHETTVMPGFILQQQTLSGLTYSYDAKTLNDTYPNLDIYDSEGLAGVDTVTMSFLLSGTNASGATEYRAGQVLLQGENVLVPVHQSDRAETTLGGVITHNRTPTTAVFRASASSDNGLTTKTAFKTGDWVNISATIVPQTADVGKAGELFVVVRSLVNGANTWSYLGQDGAFHPWPTVSIADLDGALLDPAMSSEIPVTVYQGKFATGSHFVYVGYMRSDGTGPLHYNSTALRIDVTP